MISETVERFVRARGCIEPFGFNVLNGMWVPAVMPVKGSTIERARDAWQRLTYPFSCEPSGVNGLRAAHRNAWSVVLAMQAPAVIFEDDVVNNSRPRDVHSFINTSGSCDLAFISESPYRNFLHAAGGYLDGTRGRPLVLLQHAQVCTKGRLLGIDHSIRRACMTKSQ